MKIENEVKILRFALLALLILSFGKESLAVWKSPTANPPLGNTVPPINIGPDFQHKAGSLSIEKVEVSSTGLFDRMAVGMGSNLPTVSKVEIAGGENQSGLKFTKLSSGTPVTLTTDKVLSVDSEGRVILAKVRCSQ